MLGTDNSLRAVTARIPAPASECGRCGELCHSYRQIAPAVGERNRSGSPPCSRRRSPRSLSRGNIDPGFSQRASCCRFLSPWADDLAANDSSGVLEVKHVTESALPQHAPNYPLDGVGAALRTNCVFNELPHGFLRMNWMSSLCCLKSLRVFPHDRFHLRVAIAFQRECHAVVPKPYSLVR